MNVVIQPMRSIVMFIDSPISNVAKDILENRVLSAEAHLCKLMSITTVGVVDLLVGMKESAHQLTDVCHKTNAY